MNTLHIIPTGSRKISNFVFKYGCKLYQRSISSTKILEISSYTPAEQLLIIDTLQSCVENNIIRTHLNEKRIKSLKTVFEQNPDLKSLDPLLSANGIGPKLLHRICDSILKEPSVPLGTSNQSTSGSVGSSANLSHSRWPPNLLVPLDIKPGDVKNAVSIHMGVSAVSWARISTGSTADLDQWDVLDLSSEADKKYDVHSTWNLAMQLRNLVPDADVYVMENSNWSNVANVKKPMKHHIQDAMLTSALCSVFNQSDQGQKPRELTNNRLYFLRTYSPARLFRKIIGTERVSAHDVVENMISGVTDEKHRHVRFNPGTVDLYRSLPGALRDNMCQALLLGVTFTELIILNNPIALAAISKTIGKKKSNTGQSADEQT